MKVISLHEPHALLAAYGFKTVETRDTDIGHRGWVAIHATRSDEYAELFQVHPFLQCLELVDELRRERGWEPFLADPPPDGSPRPRMDYDDLPRGAIVGVAWLAKTERAAGLPERWKARPDWYTMNPDYDDVPRWEAAFGDYSKGRMAWWLCHARPLRHPVPVRGWPGLWDTEAAAGHAGMNTDLIERLVVDDLLAQGVTLPNIEAPAFFRLVQRRGEHGR